MTTGDGNNILMVVTSTGRMGVDGPDTGLWLVEFAGPYYALADHGYTIDVASPRGGPAPIDPRSKPGMFKPEPEAVKRFTQDAAAQDELNATVPLADVDSNYRAIVLCGGHGTMWDFPYNEKLNKLVVTLNDRGSVVAAICHGAAGFVGAIHPNGESVIHNRPITCYSDAEEKAARRDTKVPFLLESKLREIGAEVTVGPRNSSTVFVDGNLVTGQGPGAVDEFCQRLIEVLHQQNMARAGA